MRFPELSGRPITLNFLPAPHSHRGKLVSRGGRGQEIHGASFIRERRIVLDTALRRRRRELERILVHELFHFAWVRLGNPRRRSWEGLVRDEVRRGVKGELGWSAESRKEALGRPARRWREYICESFCDTAAWIFAVRGRHEELTLQAAARAARRRWFKAQGLLDRIPV